MVPEPRQRGTIERTIIDRRPMEVTMRGPVTSSLVLVIAVGMGAVRAQTEQGPTAELERRFDASLDAREMAAWMKTMAAVRQHEFSP